MIITPGQLYTVKISDRGNGAVKVITYADGMVIAQIMYGRFRNRVVQGRVQIDGDTLCFNVNSEGVTVKPLIVK